jgi:hypothetical protein
MIGTWRHAALLHDGPWRRGSDHNIIRVRGTDSKYNTKQRS